MLVGVVGFIGSGKGAIGDLLVKNNGFTTDSFAKSVKDVASVIFGWDREMLEGKTDESRHFREQPDRYWSKKLDIKNFTPRQALQMVGTEAGRNIFGEVIWTAGVERRWLDAKKPNTVITDCRFPNEIDMIRKLGGRVLRITRGADPEWYQQMLFFNKGMCDEEDLRMIRQRRATKSIPHESETAWIGCNFDENISNDGTLKDLEKTMVEISDKLLEASEIQLGLDL